MGTTRQPEPRREEGRPLPAPRHRLAAALGAALGRAARIGSGHRTPPFDRLDRHPFQATHRTSSIDGRRYIARRIDACQYDDVKLVAEITEACCPQVLRTPLEPDVAEDMAAALRVLADPARLRLLSLLASAETGSACVCDLTAPLGLSQPTVSHHLKVLSDAGLVTREPRGRWAYFRLERDRLAIVQRALSP
jgi:ArsR family transcriptional regulator